MNLLPGTTDQSMFEKPLVGYAFGDDAIFTQYKTLIGLNHLTPREALALSVNKKPEDLHDTLSLIAGFCLSLVKPACPTALKQVTRAGTGYTPVGTVSSSMMRSIITL